MEWCYLRTSFIYGRAFRSSGLLLLVFGPRSDLDLIIKVSAKFTAIKKFFQTMRPPSHSL